MRCTAHGNQLTRTTTTDTDGHRRTHFKSFLLPDVGENEDSLYNCLNCLLWYALWHHYLHLTVNGAYYCTVCHYCLLTSVLHSIYVLNMDHCNVLYSIYRISNVLCSSVSLQSTDVSTGQYVITVYLCQYCTVFTY